MDIEDLKARIDKLSPVKVEFVARVVDSLSNPPQAKIGGKTWLTSSAEWMEYFGLALSVHHGATGEPLGLTNFETVFRNACDSVGWQLDQPGSSTQRFVDLTVVAGGRTRRLSLKSTAAKNLSERSVHISKLTEAAWVQDTRTPKARRDAVVNLFRLYRDAVDGILILRAFREGAGITPHRYQLIEIPVELFNSIIKAPISAFGSDAPVIECKKGEEVVAEVAVDRSDAKITVRKILVSACVTHADWCQT